MKRVTKINLFTNKPYEVYELSRNVSDDIITITEMFKKEGIEVTYVGSSDTNGYSIYFRYNGVKIRFSNHSVTNVDRIMNEIHFNDSYRVDKMQMFELSMQKVKNLK